MNIFIHQFGISSCLNTKPEQQQILVPLPCDRADGAWYPLSSCSVCWSDGWLMCWNIRGPSKITRTDQDGQWSIILKLWARSVNKSTKTLKVREKRQTKTPSGYKIYTRAENAHMNSDPEFRVPDLGHAKVPPSARKKTSLYVPRSEWYQYSQRSQWSSSSRKLGASLWTNGPATNCSSQPFTSRCGSRSCGDSGPQTLHLYMKSKASQHQCDLINW